MSETNHWSVENAYDSDEQPPSEVVIFTVAAATDTEALALDPLTSAVDPDALDAMVTSGRSDVSVDFTYHDCTVRVDDSRVVVRSLEEA